MLWSFPGGGSLCYRATLSAVICSIVTLSGERGGYVFWVSVTSLHQYLGLLYQGGIGCKDDLHLCTRRCRVSSEVFFQDRQYPSAHIPQESLILLGSTLCRHPHVVNDPSLYGYTLILSPISRGWIRNILAQVREPLVLPGLCLRVMKGEPKFIVIRVLYFSTTYIS